MEVVVSDRCQHCQRRKATHGRGLCKVCHKQPSIRSRYKTLSRPSRSSRAANGGPQCRHCGSHASRPRGLCWICYYTPGIRDQYTSTSKFARRGIASPKRQGRKPRKPTTALPGTAEKLNVMAERAQRGEQLHHPQDARVSL